MKAFQVSCRDDDHGAIIAFGARPSDVRRSNSEICDCEFIDRRARRAPAFDHLAPGPVTIAQYYEFGEFWFFQCGNCERQLFSDNKKLIIGDSVYCNHACVVARRKTIDPEHTHPSMVTLREELDAFLKPKSIVGQRAKIRK